MSDAVFDATVVAMANSDLVARKPGNALDVRARLLERCVSRQLRIRYNSRLLGEYTDHVKQRRNDLVELFFQILDSPVAISVRRNRLSASHFSKACRCRWPSHDQHLIAAALGGDEPCVYVTEEALANCSAAVHREFRVRVEQV